MFEFNHSIHWMWWIVLLSAYFSYTIRDLNGFKQSNACKLLTSYHYWIVGVDSMDCTNSLYFIVMTW